MKSYLSEISGRRITTEQDVAAILDNLSDYRYRQAVKIYYKLSDDDVFIYYSTKNKYTF